MGSLKVLSYFVIFSAVCFTLCRSDPRSGEDDEYDDDPELPDRKAVIQKLQEEMEKLMKEEAEELAELTTTSTTARPKPAFPKQKKRWAVVQNIRGYQVLTDGARIHSELIKTRPMVRISVDMPDTVRHVEKTLDERFVELKVRNWDKVHRVHVRIPFGTHPSELKIYEMKNHIDIVAPVHSDIGDLNEYEYV